MKESEGKRVKEREGRLLPIVNLAHNGENRKAA